MRSPASHAGRVQLSGTPGSRAGTRPSSHSSAQPDFSRRLADLLTVVFWHRQASSNLRTFVPLNQGLRIVPPTRGNVALIFAARTGPGATGLLRGEAVAREPVATIISLISGNNPGNSPIWPFDSTLAPPISPDFKGARADSLGGMSGNSQSLDQGTCRPRPLPASRSRTISNISAAKLRSEADRGLVEQRARVIPGRNRRTLGRVLIN